MKFYQCFKGILWSIITPFSGIIFSQQDTGINGIVYDNCSQTPYEFANISLKNPAAGTITDAMGILFKITIG